MSRRTLAQENDVADAVAGPEDGSHTSIDGTLRGGIAVVVGQPALG
jgi:hypothetical protein